MEQKNQHEYCMEKECFSDISLSTNIKFRLFIELSSFFTLSIINNMIFLHALYRKGYSLLSAFQHICTRIPNEMIWVRHKPIFYSWIEGKETNKNLVDFLFIFCVLEFYSWDTSKILCMILCHFNIKTQLRLRTSFCITILL